MTEWSGDEFDRPTGDGEGNPYFPDQRREAWAEGYDAAIEYRTDPELAELLLELTKGTPRMDGSVEMFVRKDPDRPGQVGMVMPQRYVAALHRAALLAAPADPEEEDRE